jgi:hypothetical protein
LVEQREHARIHDGVKDLQPFTARLEYAPVCEPLELIRDSLGFHPNGRGQIANAQLASAGQGMQHSKTGGVRQEFEC